MCLFSYRNCVCFSLFANDIRRFSSLLTMRINTGLTHTNVMREKYIYVCTEYYSTDSVATVE